MHFVNQTIDDAFISFRYARNLATGRGLVFNVGERVEGFSNFSWTVLFALPVWLGLDRFEFGLLIAAKVLGALCGVATIVLVSRTAAAGRPEPERLSAPLASLYLATLGPFSFWSMGGLETSMLALLLALSVHLHLAEDRALSIGQRAWPWSYVALLLAALTRPEPLVLFGPLALLRVWRSVGFAPGRRTIVRQLGYALLFALPYAAFIAWRFAYYGQLVPNTYFAKVYLDATTLERGERYLEGVAKLLNWPMLAALGVVFLPLCRRLTYRSLVALALTTTFLIEVWYEGGDVMPMYRLIVPCLPLVALLVHELWLGLGSLSVALLAPRRTLPAWVIRRDWLERWQSRVRALGDRTWAAPVARWSRVGMRAALLLALALGSYTSFGPTRGWILSGFGGLHLDRSKYFTIARWMESNVREPGLFAIGEAGIIPYYVDLPVLDMNALMDAHLSHLKGTIHRKFDVDYVLARRPKYVLLLVDRDAAGNISAHYWYAKLLLSEPRFFAQYRTLKDFGSEILYVRVPD